MRLTKPGWVHHDGKPIFSLDIHPDGSRFATGGQGKDSGRVTIWNLGPVIHQDCEKNENVPKLLCQLDNHLSCVNCVRWNHSGKFLASGGDDKLIMIWKKTGPTKLNENKVIIGVELWRCVGTLTGHSNDVLDLAWAPHDGCLASCSVDNTIIVWNMEKIPEIVAKLTGHTGLVKGVTWDPVGQYLASQSDDKSLRIWRTKDWKQQACITEPFKECGDMTHVLRLNWSPDGQYLVSAHASNSGGPTAQIIEIIERPIDVNKKSWSCEMDFVGHRKAVTCIRFNSNLLQKKPAGEGSKQTKYCALATGSRDCALAVWCTAKKRPIVVINNIFLKSVLDLSWSKDGMQLAACSWDGTIAHLMFKQEELGIIVSEQEKLTTLESMYGKSFATKHLNQTKITPIIETPELLEFVPPSLSLPNTTKTNQPSLTKTQESVEIESTKQSSMSDVLQRTKQIETRTADGKRRVTPITVPRDLADCQATSTFSSSSEFKTKIIIEQRPEVVQPNVSPLKQVQGQPAAAPSVPAAPVAHTSTYENIDSTVKNSGMAAKAVKRTNLLPTEVSSKKLATSEQLAQQHSTRCSHCEDLLEPLNIGAGTVLRIEGTDSLLEVENSKSIERPSRLRRQKKTGPDKELEWDLVYGRPITAIKSNKNLTALTCNDCTLHVVDTDTGKPRVLPIKLPGSPSCMALTTNNLVCVVTTRGYLFVWNFNSNKLILKNFTLRHTLLCESDELSSIASCEVTEDGIPLIALSCGKCYCYNEDLGWLLLTDTTSVIWKASHQDVLVRTATTSQDTKLPLKSIQSQIKGTSSLVNSRTPLAKNLPVQLCTATFLQQQMNAAIALNSPIEYKVMLLTLVRFYAQEGLLKPLRLILEDLLGPIHSFKSNWSDSILGLKKRNLLKESLSAIVQNVVCQRLYVEFNDQLNSLQEEMELLKSNENVEKDVKAIMSVVQKLLNGFERDKVGGEGTEKRSAKEKVGQESSVQLKTAESTKNLSPSKMTTDHHHHHHHHHQSHQNERAVSEISMKDFLDFLKISYQVNEAIDKVSGIETSPGDDKTCVDWKKLTADELINRLKGREMVANSVNSKADGGNEETAVSLQAKYEKDSEKLASADNKNLGGSKERDSVERSMEEKSSSETGVESWSSMGRQSSTLSLDRKVILEKGKRGGSSRKKASGQVKGDGSCESETSASFESSDDRTPAKILKKKLSEVLQEGILDSILPYLLPKQQPTPDMNVQSSVKKLLNTTNELKKATLGKAEKLASFSTKEKTDFRKKSAAYNDSEVDKKDREVVIHVCDEIKNLKRDFRCSQRLLVSQMGYFAEVTNGQKLEDMDISVHCDVTIFDWLMRWVQKDGQGQKNLPVLDPSIVIPVLMSSAFLQMDSLQDYCLQYCQTHINDIIRDSPNLSCINDNVLTRLANLFSNAEIEGIIDKKDKIQSKLFCKLISALCEPEPQPRRGHFSSIATMYRCSKCLKLILKNMSGSISCVPYNMTMDQNGLTRSVHSYDSSWNLTDYVRDLKGELKTWRKVYWRLWSDCHLLHCQACEEYFPVNQMSWCRYHVEPVQYFHVENQKSISYPIGRYSCCGERAYRFEVIKKNSGCHYRDHIFNSKTGVEVEILRIWSLFKNVIECEPPPITSNVKFVKSGFHDGRNSYKEGFWWNGLKLIPAKQPPGLLSKIWDTVTKKDDTRLGGNLSESKLQKCSGYKGLANACPNRQEMSSFSESSDESCSSSNGENSEESFHSMTKLGSKTKTSTLSSQYLPLNRNEENRFWLAKLSTRSNQDNQRDFEERALKQIELMLAKKLCGESFRCAGSRSSYQNVPVGGIYVKLEQEWREAHCFSNGCPGSSIKARGSASYVNVNSSSFTMHKRSKSRGHR